MKRRIDAADVLFALGLTMLGGGAWWLTGEPGAALAVVGGGLAMLGITSARR